MKPFQKRERYGPAHGPPHGPLKARRPTSKWGKVSTEPQRTSQWPYPEREAAQQHNPDISLPELREIEEKIRKLEKKIQEWINRRSSLNSKDDIKSELDKIIQVSVLNALGIPEQQANQHQIEKANSILSYILDLIESIMDKHNWEEYLLVIISVASSIGILFTPVSVAPWGISFYLIHKSNKRKEKYFEKIKQTYFAVLSQLRQGQPAMSSMQQITQKNQNKNPQQIFDRLLRLIESNLELSDSSPSK